MPRSSFESYFQGVARRAHAYPPPELYAPVDLNTVQQAWSDLAASQSTSPVGVYVHLPFCERNFGSDGCLSEIEGILTSIAGAAAFRNGAELIPRRDTGNLPMKSRCGLERTKQVIPTCFSILGRRVDTIQWTLSGFF